MPKKISCEYYSICKIENGKENLFDMDSIFNALSNKTAVERTKKLDSSENLYRLHELEKNDNIWEIRFLKMRKDILEQVEEEGEGAIETLELEKGKCLVDSTSALYDVESKVLFIQRNRNALTPSRIYDFFESEFNKINGEFEIRPIENSGLSENKVKRSAKQTKLELSINFNRAVSDEYKSDVAPIDSLFNILENDFDSGRAKIIITQNAKNEDGLCRRIINKGIDKLKMDPRVSTLRVNVKNGEDTQVEVVDLLLNKKQVVINVMPNEKGIYNHSVIYPKMLEKYLDEK